MAVRFDEYKGPEDTLTSFNMTEADSLLFAQISYYEFENFNPDDLINIGVETFDGMSLKKFCDLIIKLDIEHNQSKLDMLKSIIDNPRYDNCTISGCECVENDTEQWAAITIHLNDSENTSVISFRGTDGTAMGWEEDFEMAYSLNTDAQLSSKDYLNRFAQENPDANIILTGHSKGGNDAIYAYLTSGDNVRNLVSHIYNFDGPGVLKENASIYSEAYAELNEKMDTYCPQDSIIGMLLFDHSNIHYVYSDNKSTQTNIPYMSEHDAFSWYFNDDGTFQITEQSWMSKFVNSVMDDYASSMSKEDFERVMSTVADFGAFEAIVNEKSGAPLTQEGTIKKIASLVVAYNNLNPQDKQALVDTVALLIFSAGYNFISGIEDSLNGMIDEQVEKIKNTVSEKYKKANEYLSKLGLPEDILDGFEEITLKIVDALGDIGKAAISYVKSAIFSLCGSKKTYDKEEINVNIGTVQYVVDKLEKVQNIVYGLDAKLDDLRKELYFWEVHDNVKIKMVDLTMTGSSLVDNFKERVFNKGYDWELNTCIRYLNAVIKQLEDNEYGILAKSGEL